ncbi:MAG: autotransporter outer membrane beta-barrel domain-containing protein, partial [Deltaproteobacteria bacterium]|nr:autotransporter outer membrane beta-barrel domain-containing protein [Deltaproteobacteria bacterium]
LWAKLSVSYGVFGETGETAKAIYKGPEIALGCDLNLSEDFLAGLILNFSKKNFDIPGRSSNSDIDSAGLSIFAGKRFNFGSGAIRLLLGGTLGFHDIDSERQIVIGNQWQTIKADYKAKSYIASFDASYIHPLSWGGEISPFVSFGWISLDIDGFAERGGIAALTSPSDNKDNAYSHAGLRFIKPTGSRVTMEAEIGWKHLFGNLREERNMTFRQGGHPFAINGVLPNRDEFTAGIGARVKLGEKSSVILNYDGQFGSRGRNHSGSAVFQVNF